MAADLRREPFGTTADGQAVERLTLADDAGLEIRVLTFGGVLQTIRAPDRDGVPADVTLGYDSLAEYEVDRAYFGALVGRHGNRIARGRFTLDGREYRLATNDGPNHLHGGTRGFDKVVWTAEPVAAGRGVALRYVSADGEEGYPGALDVRVTYTLTGGGALAIAYEATTDAPTPVNLTQHAYFNLAGDGARDVLDHELLLAASRFTPVDETLIPTGELRAVAGTPFDFTRPTPIGARITADDAQLRHAGGYDHNFVLDGDLGDDLRLAARLRDPDSGRTLTVHTTEPGVQFYSGNFLAGERGKAGRAYRHRHGLALETQHFPDAPNQPGFPSTILRPGATYRSRTVYRFGTDADER